MKKIILIIIFIVYQNLHAQTDYFDKVKNVDTIDFNQKIDDFEPKNAYRYNEYIFLIGYTNNAIVENMGKRLFVLNKKGEIIFKSKGQLDSYYFEPYFYQSKNRSNDFIIVAEIGAEYSWGAKGFYIKNNKFYYLGFLDVSILEKENNDGEFIYTNLSRINNYLIITANGNDIFIKFKDDEKVILYPGTDREFEIESEKIYYKWNWKKLELILN